MSEGVSERERLRVYVDKSREHFSLSLARYADEAAARALWEELIADLRGRACNVAVVDFSGAAGDIDVMRRLEASAVDVDGLFVVGLEQLLVSEDDRPRRTQAVATLNFNRDLLRARVPVPVVLWLSQRATRALALLAPDTFDVLRTNFEFPAQQEQQQSVAPPKLDEAWRPRWLQLAPEGERARLERRRATLASLHAEAEATQAGDLAASLAATCASLGREDEAMRWLDVAARAHEGAGNLGAAATARRQAGELRVLRGEFEQAQLELDVAWRLAEQIAGTKDPLEVARRRGDIITARGVLEQMRERVPGDPDLELLERWRGGDKNAGGELLTRHFRSLRLYFLSRFPEAEVEDLLQETFLRLFKTLSRLKTNANARTVLLRIARSVVRERLRALYRRPFPAVFDEGDYSLGLEGRSAEDAIAESQALWLALAGLSLEDQELLELRYWHELDLNELARVFELSVKTVEARLHRARRRLAEAYATQHSPTLSPPDLEAELPQLGRRLRFARLAVASAAV